jgi:hypothetical protein
MAERTVHIEAKTHLIIHPERKLNVALQLEATFDCSWDLQRSGADDTLRHRLQLPRLPAGLVWKLDEWLDPGQTVDIYASTYEEAGGHRLL